MAFYDDENDDELNSEGQSSIATGPQSSTISGQGSAPGQAPTRTPDKSGNFVGIKQYLDANKPQANKLGDQVAGVVTGQVDDARSKFGALNSAADQQIKAVDPLDSNISGLISSGAENLTSEQRQKAKDVSKAQYTGPKDATGLGGVYSDAMTADKKAKEALNNTATEEGRMGLIGQVNKAPRTQGITTFDNALLQAGGGREKLQNVATQNQDVRGLFDSTIQGIQSRIGRGDDPNTPEDESSGAIGQSNKAQQDAYKKISDAMNAWKAGFQPKVSAAQSEMTAAQNRISPQLSGYELDQDVLDLLGLKDGDRTYGINLNDYLSQNSADQINASNLASSQDYARYGALADLAGVDPSEFILNQGEASQAGTANRNPYSAKKDASGNDLKTAIEKQKNDYIANTKNTVTVGSLGVPADSYGTQNYTYNQLKANIADNINTLNNLPSSGTFDKTRNLINAANAKWQATIDMLDGADSPIGEFSTIKRK